MDQGGAAGLRAISERCAERHAGSLTLAADGELSRKAKPLKGLEGGVFEIALRYRGDAFRTIYAVKIDVDIWVVHAFQKKSKSGVKTPQPETDVIRERLKRLNEALK